MDRDKTEHELYQRQAKTYYYPFYRNEETGILFFQLYTPMLFVMIVLFILLLIACILVGFLQSWLNSFVLVFGGILIFIFFQILHYSPKRTYVIDPNRSVYEFYKGNIKAASGPMTDIYIRLTKRVSRTGQSSYYIILGGIDIETVRLTREDTSIPKLRDLGRGIASRINLNYFDVENFSPHHIIIHSSEHNNSGEK